MANNLHVSYDLKSPGQDYQRVTDAIKKLGDAVRIHQSFWYVNSTYSAAQARDHIAGSTDNNDSIYVVDATNNHFACIHVPKDVAEFIKSRWSR